MKKTIILFLFLSLIFSCNNNQESNNTDDLKDSSEVKTGVAYAEISVKEGGEWKERKYIGGGEFKNIQELRVPDEHTDHSFYIRYEGPGWESDKVGYRLYLDWRNAIDVFGKTTDSIVLPQVGQDGFDSYHEMCSWGTDILKVGKALGVGSIGRYVEDSVMHFQNVDSTFVKVENSDSESNVNVSYYGWETAGEKIDLQSVLSIEPSKRFTKHTITPSKEVDGVCTGIVKHGVTVLKNESENKKWAYLATYGEQTLVPDKLGMAIIYKTEDAKEVLDGSFDHLVVFKPSSKAFSFYFLGAWEQEKDGIKTQEEFVKYLDGLLSELNSNDKI